MKGVEVLWPKHVALVCRKADPTIEHGKDTDFSEEMIAYALGYSREALVTGRQEIVPKEEPQAFPILNHTYKCPKHGAYYFVRVVARPLDGKMLPAGIMCVRIDEEQIVQGPIRSFLPDLEPVDCGKHYPWKPVGSLLPACAIRDGAAQGGLPIGFMLPNASKINVHVFDVTAEEPVTLEVAVLTAYYSTKAEEMVVDPKIQ